MANVNIVSDASRYQINNRWSSSWEVYSGLFIGSEMNMNYVQQFVERFPINNKRISRFTYKVETQPVSGGPDVPVLLTAGLYTDDPINGTPIAEVESSYSDTGTTTFNFSDLLLDVVGNLYCKISWTTGNPDWSPNILCMCPSTADVNAVDIPALTPKIVQPTGTKQGSGDITFAWTISGAGTQTSATLQWSSDGGVTWKALGSVGSAQTYTAKAGTFPAGTITWRIKTKSSYNLESAWVSGSFTVNYALATVTLTTPTSGSIDGGTAINFVWAITKGGGSVTGTQMAYSADNGASWTWLVNSSESVTKYAAAAGRFSAGTILWRVRARDSYAGWGAWKQASFAITYTTPTVTLTTPTSGSLDGGQKISFAWTIAKGSGSITGTQMDYSADDGLTWTSLVDSSASVTKYDAAAGKLPAGKILWRVRAKDSYAGWSAYKQASITITYSTPTVTLTTPTSGSLDGAEQIDFAWTIAKGSGSITGTQMAYSSNNGASWTRLVNSSESVTEYAASAGKFSAGTLLWRVRAKDSYAGWSAWKQESFAITYTTPTVTLTTPTSGSRDGAQQISFAWTIAKGSGSITGTQMDYSADDGLTWTSLVNSSASVTKYDAAAGKLPAGKILWRVRAKGSYAGWSAYKQASITITYSTPTVTLTTPTSGSLDGGQKISFAWTIAKGSGSITGTQMDYSADDGLTWTSLVNSSASVTKYDAAAGKLPAGKILWRVRAKDSYAGWSAYKQASITITYSTPTVTLTTPTSGSLDGAQQISFAWTIAKGSGTVVYTQIDYSTDNGINWTTLVTVLGESTSYRSSAGQFPAGTLLWRVRARDSFAGWSGYKQASITITYSAVSQVAPINTPTSGIYNAAASQSFAVALQASDIVHTPFTVASATMYWRSGESGAFTAVSMTPDGNQASVTIPAGTFPSGIIQWYAEATDNTGRTTQTETYTLTALNAAVEATPLSPISTLESGSGPITFIWTYGSIDGAPQSKAEIQYSTDGGASWTTLPEIPGSEPRAVVPAGTFSAGTITWQVRAYNEAGTAGPWSPSVSFISFSAPIIAGVLGDGKPFLTVSWQVDAQQAYEAEVNGKTYGPYYGENVRSFTLPEPLPDGSYTARVRAQNRYGLWSEWVEGNVDVTNVPGAGVPIGATNGENVELSLFLSQFAPIITEQPQDLQTTDTSSAATFRCGIMPQPAQLFQWQAERRKTPQSEWTTATSVKTTSLTTTGLVLSLPANTLASYNGYEFRFHIWPRGDESMSVWSRAAKFTFAEPTQRSPLITGYFPAEYGYFLIYRDGELIGKTYRTPFFDRTTLGTHEYYAIQVLANGYYTRSSPYPVTGTASVKCPMIAPLDGGTFIPLRLSENSRRTVNFSRRRQVEYTQYAGATFPAAEVGENETLTASFDVSYPYTDKAAADAFEALLGQDVILKSRGGQVVVGVLEGYDINDDLRFYKAYRCTLQQMDWGDFADETGSV